jgi:hypothetical protein
MSFLAVSGKKTFAAILITLATEPQPFEYLMNPEGLFQIHIDFKPHESDNGIVIRPYVTSKRRQDGYS